MAPSELSRTKVWVGMGWRGELAGGLLANPSAVDLVEVVAESCFARGPAQKEAIALSEIWPVIPHGVKLSLGSASGIDRERARRLGELARALRAPVITEHVAFTSADGREIGHLTQLPMTRTAVDVVARNVAAARRLLPDVPLLLENAAWTLRWPDDAMDEGSFYHEIVERTGCELLLDLGNIYANARNSGVEPLALLRSYPLHRARMLHLGGGSLRDGFYIDTHTHPVPDSVMELLAETLRTCGLLPILIERDGLFPPFAESIAEVNVARALTREASTASGPRGLQRSADTPSHAVDRASRRELARAQAELCALLTAPQPPAEAAPVPFDRAALFRTRDVLRRKHLQKPLVPAERSAMSVKSKQEFLAALPKTMQERLAELQQSLESGLGEDLAALLVYGGAVRGGRGNGGDDIHLMIVLRESSVEKLGRIAHALTVARYSCRVEAMLLTSAEVPQAADVFPLLYDDIRSAHVLLAGSDPFSALTITDRHRRLRIEQELREAQIRLRRLVIDSLGAREPLNTGLLRKVRQIRSPLHALLRLRNVSCSDHLDDVLHAAGKLYQVDIAPLLAIPGSAEPPVAVLARLLDAAVRDVDQIPE